jgi:hypothetical protein
MTTSTSPPSSQTSPARTRWSIVAMLAVLLAPAAALAGKKEDAKAHIARATRAHKEARYADARAELEAAYQLDPRPELLYAIGQVDAKLGNCDEAIAHYKQFAATQTDPQVAKVIEQAIAACQPAPPEPAPDSASPDHPAPSGDSAAPADRPAPANNLSSVDTPAPADRPAPGPRKPPTTKRTPPPTAPGPSLARAQDAPAATAASPRPPWYQDKVGDALVAGGVVATVIGLVEYRGALSDLDAAGDRASTTNLDRYHELIDSAHGKRTASIVFVGAGGALIGAGIVRYVVHGRATEARGVGVAPARGGGVVTYGGRF